MRCIMVTHLYDGNIQPGDVTARAKHSGFSQKTSSTVAVLRLVLRLGPELGRRR